MLSRAIPYETSIRLLDTSIRLSVRVTLLKVLELR